MSCRVCYIAMDVESQKIISDSRKSSHLPTRANNPSASLPLCVQPLFPSASLRTSASLRLCVQPLFPSASLRAPLFPSASLRLCANLFSPLRLCVSACTSFPLCVSAPLREPLLIYLTFSPQLFYILPKLLFRIRIQYQWLMDNLRPNALRYLSLKMLPCWLMHILQV